jgi:hypothetical protein
MRELTQTAAPHKDWLVFIFLLLELSYELQSGVVF